VPAQALSPGAGIHDEPRQFHLGLLVIHVEMLRVYARCVAGMEDVWIARMDATLRPPGRPDDEPGEDR
jgi:hypothetical protein